MGHHFWYQLDNNPRHSTLRTFPCNKLPCSSEGRRFCPRSVLHVFAGRSRSGGPSLFKINLSSLFSFFWFLCMCYFCMLFLFKFVFIIWTMAQSRSKLSCHQHHGIYCANKVTKWNSLRNYSLMRILIHICIFKIHLLLVSFWKMFLKSGLDSFEDGPHGKILS